MSIPNLSETNCFGNKISNSVFSNFFIDTASSTTVAPWVGAFNNLNSGNAYRFSLGSPTTNFQYSYNGKLQLQSYYGIEIFGAHRNNTNVDFSAGATTNPGLNIISSKVDNCLLALTPYTGQTGNLTEWRTSSGSATSIVTAIGNFGVRTTTPGCSLQVNGGMAVSGTSTAVTNPGAGNFSATGIISAGGSISSAGIKEFRQATPPTNPTINTIWIQTGGSPNCLWIWSGLHWLSGSAHTESESLELDSTTQSNLLPIVPVKHSNKYGLYLTEAIFTGKTNTDNDATNCWTFQLQCNGISLGSSVTSEGLSANQNAHKEQSLFLSVLPTDGLLIETLASVAGIPGTITGVFTLVFRLIYIP